MVDAGEIVNHEALDALKSVLGLEFASLIHDFNEQMTAGLVRLEFAIAHNDADRIRDVGHSLKGSALSLHCKPLAECCANVEKRAASLADGGDNGLLQELRDSMQITIQAIEDWIG